MTPFDRPVIVVGNARSGTTLLRGYLERSPSLFRLGRESRFLWNDLAHPFDESRGSLRAAQRAPEALPDLEAARGRVTAAYRRACFLPTAPESPEDALAFAHRLAAQGGNPWYYELPPEVLRARYGSPPEGPPFPWETGETAPFTHQPPSRPPAPGERVRLLDKDTGHVYRLPLLRALFPDARWVFLVRDAATAVSSLMEAWLHPRWFFSYRMPVELRIAGYSNRRPWGREWWNLNLPPDWADLTHRPLQEMAARTWSSGNAEILRHLPDLQAEGRAICVRYEDLVARPSQVLREVAKVIEVDPQELDLPPDYRAEAVVTEEPPSPLKWRRNRDRILEARPWFEEVQQRLGYQVPA